MDAEHETDPAIGASDQDALRAKIVEVLKGIYDPEIPVSIYEMGLVYAVQIDDEFKVVIRMTLTTPHCPVAVSLPAEVQTRVAAVEGVQSAEIDLIWDPPWSPERMSAAAKLELGFG